MVEKFINYTRLFKDNRKIGCRLQHMRYKGRNTKILINTHPNPNIEQKLNLITKLRAIEIAEETENKRKTARKFRIDQPKLEYR